MFRQLSAMPSSQLALDLTFHFAHDGFRYWNGNEAWSELLIHTFESWLELE